MRTLFFRCIQLVKPFHCWWSPCFCFCFCFFGCAGSSLLLGGLSLVASNGGYSLLWALGFSLRWLLLLQGTGPVCTGFSSCSTWAPWLQLPGSRAKSQQLLHTGLVALRRVEFSNPCPLHWQVDSYPLRRQGSPAVIFKQVS